MSVDDLQKTALSEILLVAVSPAETSHTWRYIKHANAARCRHCGEMALILNQCGSTILYRPTTSRELGKRYERVTVRCPSKT